MLKLKAKIDKTDAGKLNTVPVDLSMLSNVVNKKVVKKPIYDKLVTKANNIDTSGFSLKTKHDRNRSDLQKKLVMQIKKIPDNSGRFRKQIIMLELLK